eukprot:scaffold92383_cov33-Tisochrysis_lutea.AAC.2
MRTQPTTNRRRKPAYAARGKAKWYRDSVIKPNRATSIATKRGPGSSPRRGDTHQSVYEPVDCVALEQEAGSKTDLLFPERS